MCVWLARPIEHHFHKREQGTRLYQGRSRLAAGTYKVLAGSQADHGTISADLTDQFDWLQDLIRCQLGDRTMTKQWKGSRAAR